MEKVSKKILDDAQKEYTRIIKEAEQEVLKIKKQTTGELNKLDTEIKREADRARESEKRRLIGMARLKIRDELLSTKREIMDSIFAASLQKLINRKRDEPRPSEMGRGEYLGLIKLFLRRIGFKEGEVSIGVEEDKIDAEFIKKINRELETNFSLSKKRVSVKGGFILYHGKIEIDSSFKAILDARRERLELKLAQLLFK
ncbi:V-type ATP synthase subunit E [candidate division WOR-3 bacterium]|nr:V-type ATP synthase subunit E [candidate division WOR-3 bacterium]